ncbi:MAG: Phosphate regulon sensor protein phoR [Candidatus Wolfebacteria bacterium GW2011_GWC1_37_10]|uniref:histidine kinase n=1 Tax=Candidatus Wolfebacteria bacterium GW2011_GWC1_37_10 TaxID=1619010 RepID=A0A0G0ICQ8_9BACT|nr:MAG: Phosphate regulon sensor protein phoR [Candidatus Wolfebacteria bacterium GW2011_GWC1_37_10]
MNKNPFYNQNELSDEGGGNLDTPFGNVERQNQELSRKIKYLKNSELAMLNILEDVRELEKSLKEERDRDQAIISSIGEGLIVIDRDYKIALMNERAKELLGVSFEEAMGQNAKDIIKMYRGEEILPDKERPVEIMFKTGEPVKVILEDNFYYQTISKKKFPIILTTAPLWGRGLIGAVVVFQDITEEKALSDSRNNFISVASHQLRTPLTSIRWYAEMLINGDGGKLNKNQNEFTNQIYSAALKLNETVNLLLAISRLEGKKMEMKLAETNLEFFVKDIIKGLKPLIKYKKIKVNVLFDKNLPKKINVDASILNQIFTNLLSNSINYTDDRGQIEITIRKEDNNIVWSIRDDGIGVPDDQKSMIFNKFFRANNAVAKIPNGTGLGLTLVKALLERLGGKVGFESPIGWINKKGIEEKKGTMFWFTTPIA